MSDTIKGITAGESPQTVVMEVLESGFVKDAEGQLYQVVKSGEQTFFHRVEAEVDALVHEGLAKAEEFVSEEADKLLGGSEEPAIMGGADGPLPIDGDGGVPVGHSGGGADGPPSPDTGEETSAIDGDGGVPVSHEGGSADGPPSPEPEAV